MPSAQRPSLPRRYKAFTRKDLERLPQLRALGEGHVRAMQAIAAVLPFRTNAYVVDELIDWRRVPDDPIYQLTFPQPEMLEPGDFRTMLRLVESGAGEHAIRAAARKIQMRLNPHPAGQMSLNVPVLRGERLPGLQHKYRETVLFFPSQGQTCHAYCTYCFRWAQFVGMEGMKFAQREMESFHQYLREHVEIRDVLFTGGDPMVMRSKLLRQYIEPLLGPGFEHVQDIRIGTKAVAYWPYRFVTDEDADDFLRLVEDVQRAGKHLAIMAHYSHPRELMPDVAQTAIRRLRDAGAEIRCQAPLIRHVNDEAHVWRTLWETQVRLGAVPYYMFVERDTGPKAYFEVPLARALTIFRRAWREVTGLARTVRGPSMSATPGKVQVDGVAEIQGERVFCLSFLRGRNKDWVRRPFFARYDETATWLDELEPAFGEERFFFEDEMDRITARAEGLARAEL